MKTIQDMRNAMLDGTTSPEVEVEAAYERLEACDDDAIVINTIPREVAVAQARDLSRRDAKSLPLYGIPFAVKDNIDVRGVATTAGCPAYAYQPAVNATSVERLVAAGAIPIAKTNLDQFATGLVGTRSPFGIPRLPWAPDHIPGGSSSGSAVCVARGIVPFALGTDTAGSGRVPAAFTGIVGVKPTRGRVSTVGVVPAIRSLDCVSTFTHSVRDGSSVLDVLNGFDPNDPMSRFPSATRRDRLLRVGITGQVPSWVRERLARSTFTVDVDIEPFIEIGATLYGGPWVAGRVASVGAFIERHYDEVDPIVRDVIMDARRWTAEDVIRAEIRLAEMARATEEVWERVDVIVAPTTPRHPTIAEVLADPLGVNTELGRFTNFVNLLDLCAVACPPNITVMARSWHDADALGIAAQISGIDGDVGSIDVAVVGAHLSGEPLHFQLVELGAQFVASTITAPSYRLYALANTTPPKPGLVREQSAGASIEVEVYRLNAAAFGQFVASIPQPLAIGCVDLIDGRSVRGFVCEPAGLHGARDITELGGWRHFEGRKAPSSSDAHV